MKKYLERIDIILNDVESLVKDWENIEKSKQVLKLGECLRDIKADLMYDDIKCHMMISQGLVSFAGNFLYKEPDSLLIALMLVYSTILYRAERTREIPGGLIVSESINQIPICLKEMCAKKEGSVDQENVRMLVGLFNSGMQNPSWGYRMDNQEIDLIYQGIRISEGELLYHDYAVDDEVKKVPLSSLEAMYAIGITFARLYAKTISALWAYDSSANWCPIKEWQTLNNISVELQQFG